MRALSAGLVGLVLSVVVGCSLLSGPTADPGSLATCEQAFRRWVDGAAALNRPEADIGAILVEQETIQRRVFELCSLADAERFNREMPLELAPGLRQPMIQPDVRTFAEVECVDESPLLDDTPLCAEVGG